MQIKADSFVQMNFSMRLKDGSIAEDTSNYDAPFVFQMGKDIFSEKAESELIGLCTGDKKKVILLPGDAFGDDHPAMIYSVPKFKFPADMELEEGLIVSFAQNGGGEMMGILQKIGKNDVMVDFNHPLAGQIIVFEVEILKVAKNEENLYATTIS